MNNKLLKYACQAGKILSDEEVEQLAKKSGLQQRTPRKISAQNQLQLLCVESVKITPSYNDLAIRMENMTGEEVSKQAFWKRINTESSVSFLKLVLAKTMQPSAVPSCINKDQFKRILIGDSSIIQLPQRLFAEFSGVGNQHSQVCNARIQVAFNLLNNEFTAFSIDPYTKNDLKAAKELEVEEGDLVLRDRGYSSYEEIKRVKDKGADIILRHKHSVIYLDHITHEPLDLLALLRKDGSIDMQVCLNNKDKTTMRLIAIPAGEEIANKRRRNAKKEAKGHSVSKETLQLLSWTIFITTLPKEKADFSQIFKLYALRWRIESIFKTWKSYLNFSSIHNVSKNQFLSIMIARLIIIVIANVKIFDPLQKLVFKSSKRYLSLFKTIRYLQVNNNILLVLGCIKINNLDDLVKVFTRYCTYESRKNRPSFLQNQEDILCQFA